MTTTRDGIRGTEYSMVSVRERFGGVDTPAAIVGMLAAFGTMVFLSALIAAGAGSIEYAVNAFDIEGNAAEVAATGIVSLGLVVLASFFVGGWAAGRISRYDGGVNGLACALWALLLIVVFGALGAWFGAEYNAFQQVGLPDWASQIRGDDVTSVGIIAAVVGVAAMFLGAYLGGRLGEIYHRKADAAIADSHVGYQPVVAGDADTLATDRGVTSDPVVVDRSDDLSRHDPVADAYEPTDRGDADFADEGGVTEAEDTMVVEREPLTEEELERRSREDKA